jgi:hypothetical protein
MHEQLYSRPSLVGHVAEGYMTTGYSITPIYIPSLFQSQLFKSVTQSTKAEPQ